MEILPLIIQIVSGAGGGTGAAKLFSKFDEGLLINLGVGLAGGVVLGQLFGVGVGMAVPDVGSTDLPLVLSSLIGGLLGGAGALALVGTVGKGAI